MAGCRKRLPSTRQPCGLNPISRKRTPTWRTPWRRCPAGCRRRLPSTRRRCGLSPISRKFTSTWQTRWSTCRLPEAIAEYRAALRIQPDYADAHDDLASALARTPAGCRRRLPNIRRPCAFNPIARQLTTTWRTPWRRRPGRLPEAIAEYQAALRIDPDFAEAHTDLGNTLARMPGGCRRRLPSMKRPCGSGPIPSCGKQWTDYGLISPRSSEVPAVRTSRAATTECCAGR